MSPLWQSPEGLEIQSMVRPLTVKRLNDYGEPDADRTTNLTNTLLKNMSVLSVRDLTVKIWYTAISPGVFGFFFFFFFSLVFWDSQGVASMVLVRAN
ncbi:hypothetical protein BDV37DRAFT_119227 [Aspergillus pseudonomiae]|uniref:Uncharacterized protein n=1 Tax=Aspergillus pseudonomiae TaxID=1506151 RepID=A0A5N7DC12_9EURO|nr:uncharacterized protein BDV37DRAFT_119227 [Aspergillus pseudonomiae]KAE8403932.1 hypothetical protein BDV37DRAFT_119227 [Aspergillus pseudonomiae]